MADEKKCLTKADLTNVLYDLLWQDEIDRQRCAAIVEDYIEIIKDGLAKDGKVMISGFGSYEVNYKEPRRGRNPQTGETMILRERRVVKFKPSQLLRKEINAD
jgi:integration host factor subunit alpha